MRVFATAPQIRFLISLASERLWAVDLAEATLTSPEDVVYKLIEVERGTCSVASASRLIDTIKAERPVVRQIKTPTPSAYIEDGIYFKDGVVYKVIHAVHGSGKQYAKALNTDSGRFEYAAGAIRNLTPAHRMTREQASEFGHLYGICCACGATLTDETSIELGIGPVCGKRF